MTHDNVTYLADRPIPWAEADVRFVDDYKDLWIAVLRRTMEDYWTGIRKGQHRKLGAVRIVHHGRRDAEEFQDWLNAANWLLSTDTAPRSFLWLAGLLQLDPELVYVRMKKPPVRVALVFEEEE
jgi:hypothetical protein